MSTRLRVAVVQGGPSSEASVSRASAVAIADALREAGHDAVRLELDAFLAETLRGGGYDVAFPIAHGAVGEDGSLQGLLEVQELAYVGSGVVASAVAMHKDIARILFEAAGLPVARGRTFPIPGPSADRAASSLEAATIARAAVGKRVVVKPTTSGSAIGVSRFREEDEDGAVAEAIRRAWDLHATALVEAFAVGREVTCGVLDLGDALDGRFRGGVALPPTEIFAEDAFYTYEAKYGAGMSRHACPAELGPELTQRIQSIAAHAHRVLGCRDLSRADFVVGDGDDASKVVLLEVNTLPGFTRASLFPEAAGVAGIELPVLVSALARVAHQRGTPGRNAPKPLP